MMFIIYNGFLGCPLHTLLDIITFCDIHLKYQNVVLRIFAYFIIYFTIYIFDFSILNTY